MENNNLVEDNNIKKESSKFPFWKRLLALLIDIIILAVIGTVIGNIFAETFIKMGLWSRIIGGLIALSYFGILNSDFNQGQTVGKKMMKIKVVNEQGENISLAKSYLRTLILLIPFLLNNISFSSRPNFLLSILLGIIIFGGTLGVTYFFIFNLKTRQTLHDIISKTYVVSEKGGEGLKVKSTSRKHFVIFSILVLTILSSGIFLNYKFDSLVNETFVVAEELKKIEEFNMITVNSGEQKSIINGEVRSISSFYVGANIKSEIRSQEEKDRIMNLIIEEVVQLYPDSLDKDIITVSLRRGYDIFIASNWEEYKVSLSPSEWEGRLRR